MYPLNDNIYLSVYNKKTDPESTYLNA